MENEFDSIIIGSGIGGLCAALTIANEGKRVLVLEAAQSFGGYLNPFVRKKFHFDTGLHYIGQAGPDQQLRQLLDQLGLGDIEFNELSPDGFDCYNFPDYKIKFGKGIANFQSQLLADFPEEKSGINKFFTLLARMEQANKNTSKIKEIIFALSAIRHNPLKFRWKKAVLKQLLDYYFQSPNLKAAISGPCGDLGLPPGRLAALAHVLLLNHYKDGAYYPKGGTGKMIDAFVGALQSKDATLKNRAIVKKILHNNGRVYGVKTEDGDIYHAKVVISNAQACDTYKMVGMENLPRPLQDKVKNLEYSIGSIIVFLGVDNKCDVSRVGDRNIWHYESNDIDALYAKIFEGELPDGSSFFLSVPSMKDPTGNLAPEGKHTVEILSFCSSGLFRRWFQEKVGRRGQLYNQIKEEVAESLIRGAEKYIPDLSQHIEVKEVSTPATNYSYVRCPDGNIYGPEASNTFLTEGRFHKKSPINGLFLCGASTSAAGVVSCAFSGRSAGRLALQYLNVPLSS